MMPSMSASVLVASVAVMAVPRNCPIYLARCARQGKIVR